MRILVIHPGALGDILLSLPAIALLRKQQPCPRISLACNSDYIDILRWGCVDEALTLATLPLHRLYGTDPLPMADVALWNFYDRIVSWTGFDDTEFARNFRRAHSQVIISPWRPGLRETRHVSRIFADSLHPWIPKETVLPWPQLGLGSEEIKAGESWLSGRGWSKSDHVIALHPGAGSAVKRWRLDYFRIVMESLLKQERMRILVIEGPAEAGVAAKLASRYGCDRVSTAQSLSLTLVSALLLRCRGFLGNDSGIAHLAAILRVPSLVLFGPTLPHHWAPLGEQVAVLRNSRDCWACKGNTQAEHSCLDALAPDLVASELTRLVGRAIL